ncbi:MAG: hypothetical protein ABSH36_09635 [Solirubrobacteraceae bacterium]
MPLERVPWLRPGSSSARQAPGRLSVVSPTWIWMQIAIVVFVVIGMIIAITKLA